jgi:hypothetical protein
MPRSNPIHDALGRICCRKVCCWGVRNLKNLVIKNLVIEKQQSLRILIVQVSSSEKVRADHLQAVAARFVGV